MPLKPTNTTKTKGTKASTSAGRKLPKEIPVTIDGVPVILRAAKGKRTYTAAQLKAAVTAAKDARSSKK